MTSKLRYQKPTRGLPYIRHKASAYRRSRVLLPAAHQPSKLLHTHPLTMSSFKKLWGFGGEDKESARPSSSQSTSAVSAEHQGPQPPAAQKASNMVPATLAERDEAAEDTTVCVRESEVADSDCIELKRTRVTVLPSASLSGASGYRPLSKLRFWPCITSTYTASLAF